MKSIIMNGRREEESVKTRNKVKSPFPYDHLRMAGGVEFMLTEYIEEALNEPGTR